MRAIDTAALRDRVATEALNWYERQVRFNSTPRNLEAGEAMGQAEQALRTACAAFFEAQRADAVAQARPSEEPRRELLLGAPAERLAHPYGHDGGHD